jgi:hypothetical protein
MTVKNNKKKIYRFGMIFTFSDSIEHEKVVLAM